jgi:hypothetical protein
MLSSMISQQMVSQHLAPNTQEAGMTGVCRTENVTISRSSGEVDMIWDCYY